MLLVLDIGNTEITLGLFLGNALARSFRMSSETRRTADEIALVITQAFPELSRRGARGSVLASVVPSQTPLHAEALRMLLGELPVRVDAAGPHGLTFGYRDPMSIGPDRIANAMATLDRHGAPAVVVDFGTATTFDVLLPPAQYLGGVIAPGILTGAEHLVRRAARLSAFELRPPDRVVGASTEESLQAGVFYGAVGQVDAIVRRIAEEERITPRVVATGGLAASIAPHSKTIEVVEPDLTLYGLRLFHAAATASSSKLRRPARSGRVRRG